MESTIENTALQTRYRSIITAKHEALTVPSFNWAPDGSGVEVKTNWRTRRVTGNEDDYYPDCRTPPSHRQISHTIDLDEFKTTSITSNGCNWPPDTGDVATAPLNASIHCGNLESSETKWRTRRVSDIEDDKHEYKTIPTSQLSAITSPSTYNGRSALTPECCNIENQRRSQRCFTSQNSYDYNPSILSEVHLSQFACTPTALATSKMPTCRSILRPTYGY